MQAFFLHSNTDPKHNRGGYTLTVEQTSEPAAAGERTPKAPRDGAFIKLGPGVLELPRSEAIK